MVNPGSIDRNFLFSIVLVFEPLYNSMQAFLFNMYAVLSMLDFNTPVFEFG